MTAPASSTHAIMTTWPDSSTHGVTTGAVTRHPPHGYRSRRHRGALHPRYTLGSGKDSKDPLESRTDVELKEDERCNKVYTRDEDRTLQPGTKAKDCDAEAVPDRDIVSDMTAFRFPTQTSSLRHDGEGSYQHI